MTQQEIKLGDIVKLKNPIAPFQLKLRYKVILILKTVYHLQLVDEDFVYKNVRKTLLILV